MSNNTACVLNDTSAHSPIGYEGEVSADAAGIIATLFALSHLSFKYQSDLLAEGYNRLYGFAAVHTEAFEIFQAID